MAEEKSRKCTYFNSGYCKFTRKENGCRNLHPAESCQIPKCRDKGCPLRHPKTCRYGTKCKRIDVCQFKHNVKEIHIDADHIKKDIIEEKEKVQSLQADILNLNLKIEEQKKMLNTFTIEKERVTKENITINKEREFVKAKLNEQQKEIDLLKVKMKEQQKDIFEIRNNLNDITDKKETLQHEIDTIKNIIINKMEQIKHEIDIIKSVKDSSLPKKKQSVPKKRNIFKCKVCKEIFQTSEDLNDHCSMELYCKTCEECIGCYYESDQCYPDEEHHKTHDWELIQNRCRECYLISKNATALQSHMKRKHGS